MAENDFKKKFTFEDRKMECDKMLEKFSDKLPVITERLPNSNMKHLDRKKYLLPNDLLVSQFYSIIRKRLELNKNEAMFVFFGNKHVIVTPSTPMTKVYEENKDEDGFLYCYYTGENTFGSYLKAL